MCMGQSCALTVRPTHARASPTLVLPLPHCGPLRLLTPPRPTAAALAPPSTPPSCLRLPQRASWGHVSRHRGLCRREPWSTCGLGELTLLCTTAPFRPRPRCCCRVLLQLARRLQELISVVAGIVGTPGSVARERERESVTNAVPPHLRRDVSSGIQAVWPPRVAV